MTSEGFAALLGPFGEPSAPPQYAAFCDRFKRQLFFEAHEVLEAVWLPERGRPRALFLQGLIQVAGAFVHVQKGRPGPAASLLRLARANLLPYTPRYEGLRVDEILQEIERVLLAIEAELADPAQPLLARKPFMRKS